MTLEEFGNELKQQRLAKNISLSDIANATRINLKFLEALEEGHFHILPPTYVRAFLREYAQMVDLDPNSILQQYSSLTATQGQAEAGPTSSVLQNKETNPLVEGRSGIVQIPRQYYLLGGIILLGVVLWLLYSTAPQPPDIQRQEIPFEHVIKENELSTGTKPEPLVRETPPPEQKIDSLVLEMTTTDSVWINLVIDNATPKDFLFPPNVKRIFRAANQFTITMGNAGAASFRLNGKELGLLGKRGAVVRNRVLSRQILQSP